MRAARSILTLLVATLLIAACGGGASTPFDAVPTASKATAFLTGEIVSVDGSTGSLDGVLLGLRETGDGVVTDLDGSFSFGEVPTGTLTIDIISIPATSAKSGEDSGHDDSGHHGDDDPPHHDEDDDGLCDEEGHQHQNGECFDDDEVEDGEDADDDDLSVHRVRAREQIHIRLRLENGAIGTMECVREQNREREVEMVMARTEANDDPDMKGKLELESREDRERLKVRVERSDTGRQLELWATAPNGNQEALGTCTADGEGEARWTFDTSNGARLPFGLGSVEDLEGHRFEVRDGGTGAVMLRVNAPALPQARVQAGGV